MSKATAIILAIAAVFVTLMYWLRNRPRIRAHVKSFFKSHAEYIRSVESSQRVARECKACLPKDTELTAQDVIRVCREMGHDGVATALESLKLPCVYLVPRIAGEGPLVSRIGGLPSLSDAKLWPKHNGKSLAFIAQLNLSELPRDAAFDVFSRDGVLYFFYDAEQSTWGFDPEDKGSWSVIYSERSGSSTVETPYPEDLPPEARYSPKPVSLQAGIAIPNPVDLLSGLETSEEVGDCVEYLYGKFIEHGGPRHQLLGYAAAIQGDMHLECQLVSHGLYCGDSTGYDAPQAEVLRAGAECWRLLLQVDTDEEVGMMWGDCGRLYFWITEDDLRKRNFGNVWMILQCY